MFDPLGLHQIHLKDILSIAQNERERECIRYTAFAVSGLSATGARKRFGLERITERALHVQRTIEEIQAIRSAIHRVSKTQKVALAQFGVQVSDESDSTLDGSEDDVTSLSEQSDTDLSPKPSVTPQETDLVELLHSAHFNCFEFTCLAEERGISQSVLDEQLKTCVARFLKLV